MSVAKRLCVVSPMLLVNLWCGKAQVVPLCRVLPDTATLQSYCSFNIATATFADVVSTFRLNSALDSTLQSVVALQTPTVQLSFGSEYSSMRDATEPIRAAVPVRSVFMRRYFSSPKEATDFLATLRQHVERTFTCVNDALDSESRSMLCRDPNNSGTEIRYLWTSWADLANPTPPFEVSVLAQF